MLFACNKLQYSVYNASIQEKQEGITNINIRKIQALTLHENFKFAVISDIHLNYDNLEACIDTINKQTNLDFVIVSGDFTDKGLLMEYQLVYHFLSALKVPYLTVVGNHDLGVQYGNGKIIYQNMFGDINYTVIIHHIKFIFFDSNLNVAGNTINFNWLNKQLTDTSTTNKFFLISHQDPGSPSFVGYDSLRSLYQHYINDPHILYSIFGHEHFYYNNDSLRFVIVDDLKTQRHYCIVSVKNLIATVQHVSF
jgi:predicted phosphodiesterase